MKNSFISNVADYILEHYSGDPDLCVVLPNRRAGLFLKKAISGKITTTLWAPEIITIEEFTQRVSGISIADRTELLIRLYEIVCADERHEAEPFESFMKWAPVLISDYSDADAWLADTDQLFTNLAEIKYIEDWSLNNPELTPFQKKYLAFWDRLADWYHRLKMQMLQSNKGWSGLAYRLSAEQNALNNIQWSHVIFAGFNALNKSEEKIFQHLIRNGKADTLWDADEYYLNDSLNEAGKFMRRNKENFFSRRTKGEFSNSGNHFSSAPKEITVVSAARNISQARACGTILSNSDFDPEETAVVLADENLLIPVLDSIPEKYGEVNVSMGYSMRNTPVYTLLLNIFSLQENVRRFQIRSAKGEVKFYHQDVMRLLRHPYVAASFHNTKIITHIIRKIARYNATFVSLEQIKSYGEINNHNIPEFLFREWKTSDEIVEQLQLIPELFRSVIQKEESEISFDTEFLYQLKLSLNRISTLYKQGNALHNFAALKSVVIQGFSATSIPFSGEPLRGLQVMGMLETRLLDFKNVIIVSANEGVLPDNSMHQSFIMYDLRRHFEMPLYHEKDSITSYNVHRLLQRANNIVFICNSDQDAFGTKEKSRFITQLETELPVVNPQARFNYLVAASEPGKETSTDSITLHSNPDVVQILTAKASDGFSPSMISSFRECRLQFYFRYVTGIRDEDEVTEDVDQNMLGTIIHNALEELYKPYVNAFLTEELIHRLKPLAEKCVRDAYKNLYQDSEASTGKNLLALKIANRYISQFFEFEIARIRRLKKAGITITVTGLEEQLEYSSTVNGTPVKYIGKSDRIERKGETVCILDYKTGSVQKKDVAVADWAQLSEGKKTSKAFQLLMYAWLYIKGKDLNAEVESGLISFRKLKEGTILLTTPEGSLISNNNIAEFEIQLKQLTEEILSEQTVFHQTEDSTMCRFCTFNKICRRYISNE